MGHPQVNPETGQLRPAQCLVQSINQSINLLRALLTRKSYYFDRDDVALSHVAKYFKEQSHEEREHAEKLMKYQNKRGGRVVLQDVKKPLQDEWGNSLDAMLTSLQMEKNMNQALLDLHKLAMDRTDPQLGDFLEEYLEEQVKAIKQRGDHITNLRRLGMPQNGMGEYLFDKHTLGESS
ncbi:ferritin heavy chain B-like isoform X1 [Pleurodeles waltl]|uniref:ferritin heavy chain B-like isoform X1 n=1 Tax=Pleurodeles waltl TaxID=8319 RepID=UPI00370986D5